MNLLTFSPIPSTSARSSPSTKQNIFLPLSAPLVDGSAASTSSPASKLPAMNASQLRRHSAFSRCSGPTNKAPPAGYTESIITWTGFKGLENVTFHGTIEQVMEQLKQHGEIKRWIPNVDDDTDNEDSNGDGDDSDGNDGSLAKRGDPPSHNLALKCHLPKGYDDAKLSPTRTGVRYLRGLHDDVMCGNGVFSDPQYGACGRISCSWGAAIKWCNHNTFPVVYRCNLFAKYANDVAEGCNWKSKKREALELEARKGCKGKGKGKGKIDMTRGQEWDLDYGISTFCAHESC
ncbi:hypothetical protein F4778DRAFT_785319 [Xylariomycetidae sp. FL2044]|nr:hypothetical protein F4778DRAFT_785319 [Xylariomycetidae sp. FL2044]